MSEKKRRLAAIDIGSNSVRLLVADVSADFLSPVLKDKRTSRLIAGLKDGRIDEAALSRTEAALLELVAVARDAGAEEIRAFGTSALRDGENRDRLIDAARDMGVELIVLSGQEEAAMAYRGAAPAGDAGILDIGGGSTEWLAGRDGQLLRAASTQIGAVRLYEMTKGGANPRQLIEYAVNRMQRARDYILTEPVSGFTGVGGTITTLAAMQLQLEQYSDEAVTGHVIRAEAARSFLDMLWAMPVSVRRSFKGLEPARADILPAGLSILCAFFELTGERTITASGRDNLEGFISQYMSR